MTSGRHWQGKDLSKDGWDASFNVLAYGSLLDRDFAHRGQPTWFWFVQAAQAVEKLEQEDPITLWTIGAHLNKFPVAYDEDGRLVFGSARTRAWTRRASRRWSQAAGACTAT
ncbi:MAG: hypothetical protein A2092_15810 [Rhodobacteraceae bacterium GWE1_64_9]|nr:MAG: hypothetical protein A2092_15810 [Rhodobacteraceae bacterium GWE1_64_9]